MTWALTPPATPSPLADGTEFMLEAPVGDELPPGGFGGPGDGYIAPIAHADRSGVDVVISPTSDRIERLTPLR